ncbi:MAG TPA: (4Fe-4S)-binding protein [Chitinophagaceae bacterium]
MTQKEYTNKEITVTWKPEVCQHSAKCWKGLIQVFNPSNRPWINMSNASTERIIEQIKKCPSGALGYYYNSENSTHPFGD